MKEDVASTDHRRGVSPSAPSLRRAYTPWLHTDVYR
jgi:hypothetical protein